MKQLSGILLIIALIAIIGGIIYGSYQLSRKFNYSMSYKSMVEQTVREMVKESALRENK